MGGKALEKAKEGFHNRNCIAPESGWRHSRKEPHLLSSAAVVFGPKLLV